MELIYQLSPVLTLGMLLVWLFRRDQISKKHGLSPIYQLLLLIAVNLLVLYVPYYWVSTDVNAVISGTVDAKSLITAIGSVLNALVMAVLEIPRHFALALPYETLSGIINGTPVEYYRFAQVLLWILAPLGTASFVYMLIRTLLRDLKLKLCRKNPVYYFSSLNEKSFTLAKNLYEANKNQPKHQRPYLVFCQVDTGDESDSELQFRAEAEEIGAFFQKDPVHALDLKDPLRQEVQIFLMDEDEDINILSLLRMEEHVCPIAPIAHQDRSELQIPRSDLYVFSTHESTELIFDKTLENFQQMVQQDKMIPRYNLHLIDETRMIIQKLLLEHPLYEPLFHVAPKSDSVTTHPDADRHDLISVLAIGGGQLGMELVRNAMICGVTDSYDFQIQIIDQNAKTLEKQFRYFSSYREYLGEETEPQRSVRKIRLPDIFSGDDGLGASIKPIFHEADCRSMDFDHILEKHCIHCNYIVIATGDDELNISTARYLQRWYARQDIMRGMIPSRPPMIFAAIRNSERYEALHRLEDESAARNVSKQLFLFGNNDDIFSAEGILNRSLDNCASLFHKCYTYDNGDKLQLDALCTPLNQRQEMRYDLSRQTQVNQFSNQMVALHSLYKMQDLMFANGMPKRLLEYRYKKEHPLEKITLEETESLFAALARCIRTSGEKLHRLEHRRWNLFYLLDGWECFPMEMITTCYKGGYTPNKDKRHQLPLIKLHGCLVPFDALDELSDLCEKKRNAFKGYDACMCSASLFAWLDLEASPEHAKIIRTRLLEAAAAKWNADNLLCTCDELLELIIDTFTPVAQ